MDRVDEDTMTEPLKNEMGRLKNACQSEQNQQCDEKTLQVKKNFIYS